MYNIGIKCLQTVEDTCTIGCSNGDAMWENAMAIAKEMKHVQVALNIIDAFIMVPNGYQFIKSHMILDIKRHDSFSR